MRRREHLQGLHTMAQEWLWQGHSLPALTWRAWLCLPRSLIHLALRWSRASSVLHQSCPDDWVPSPSQLVGVPPEPHTALSRCSPQPGRQSLLITAHPKSPWSLPSALRFCCPLRPQTDSVSVYFLGGGLLLRLGCLLFLWGLEVIDQPSIN